MRGSLVALKTFSRWLADEDVLTADPLARLRLPRVDQGVVTAPTDDELLALLWAAGPLLRTVLGVLMGTGMRIGARRPDTAAARVDVVPARSPLGKAVARVLAGARGEGDRRRWMTCLGTFLLWCDRRGVPATECWLGDLAPYRRQRLEAGYRSPGEYMRVARMLLEQVTANEGDGHEAQTGRLTPSGPPRRLSN